MSGHSKWSKVKHQKEVTDAVKGKAFTKLGSAIIIAVREGGGIDPVSNFRLRLAIEKAHASNMPKDTIERAIEKGAGKGEGSTLQTQVYEAFAQGKTGLIIEATTDNHQRTTSEIKNILDRGGGVLAAQGAVSYLFSHVGAIQVEKSSKSFDEMMEIVIEAGGEDLVEREDIYLIYTRAKDLHQVKVNLDKKKLITLNSELIYKPEIKIKVDEGEKGKIIALIQTLSEAPDVQNVYSTLDND